MELALEQAENAANRGECPIGAVVVLDGEVIGRGHNRVEELQDVSQHAEVVALREAAQALNNWRLNHASLYVTLEPCPMCVGALLLARVQTLYYAATDPRLGAVGSLFDLSQHPGLPHRIEVVHGEFAERSKELLAAFFRQRRESTDS